MAGHVHPALTLFFSQRLPDIWERTLVKASRTGGVLGSRGWDNLSPTVYVMLSVRPAICKLSRLLSIGHSWPWRQDRFQKCSCSSIPTPTLPHIHPHTHAQPASIQWAMKQTFYFLSVYLFFLSLTNHALLLAAHISLSDVHPGEE